MDHHADYCIFVKDIAADTTLCSCGFRDRDSERKFADKHAIVHQDHLVEMKRRRTLWATCPNSNGHSLDPDAQIVPLQTLLAAITEIQAWREAAAKIKTKGHA